MRSAVVIPALNEARTIRDLVSRAARHADLVVVIDDGSDDSTGDQLLDTPATVLRNRGRMGKAASLWRGFSYAVAQQFHVIITMDGDGQHSPEDIPGLIAMARVCPGSIIIAARLRERETMPAMRKFGNWMADFWISWAAGYPIRDTQSGFRLYPGNLLKTIRVPHDERHGFVLESEILIEAARLGWDILHLPVDCVYERELRASHYRPTRDTVRIIRMVAGKLIRKGLYPLGLLRSLGMLRCPKART